MSNYVGTSVVAEQFLPEPGYGFNYRDNVHIQCGVGSIRHPGYLHGVRFPPISRGLIQTMDHLVTVVVRRTFGIGNQSCFHVCPLPSSSSIPSTQFALLECCHEPATCRQCLRRFGNLTILQVGLMWRSKACSHHAFDQALHAIALPDSNEKPATLVPLVCNRL